MDELEILPLFFSRYDFKYLGGKSAYNLPKNVGSTKGVLLIP